MKSVEKAISNSKSKIHTSRLVFTQIHVELFLNLRLLEQKVDIDSSLRQIERIMMRKGLKLFK